MISSRIQNTDRPFIEDVLEQYADLEGLTRLALGSSHWGPPTEACDKIIQESFSTDLHKYGSIMGLDALRLEISSNLQNNGLDMGNMEVMITSGANQAFVNAALAICDPQDNALLISPFYFSHKNALQLADVKITNSTFDKSTLKPNWPELETQIKELQPSMIVLTTPNNPSGITWNENEISKLIDLCRISNTWLVVDQTYFEFIYDGVSHVFPCSVKFNYTNIIHISSLSKSFGMPGWRVGYIVYPKHLSEHFRKIQDTVPTHCSMIGQKLGLYAMRHSESYRNQHGISWVDAKIRSLDSVRTAVWEAVESMGGVRSSGAFYFLVPIPVQVSEDEAVGILAHNYGILLMHGSAFGAEHHLRLSYGSLPPDAVMSAVQKLREGLEYIRNLAAERLSARAVNLRDNLLMQVASAVKDF
eukprot:gene3376-6694_t